MADLSLSRDDGYFETYGLIITVDILNIFKTYTMN